ncbi:uncharacterized protein [Cicer arietinum]|uniref:Uncharacterized protein At3g28850 n=1 Tax=Cicer arietinum TaxID=3827 RepID=A0A1S2Z2C0_CICAR|nr:uncharacterized protein At3g28850 [Cicer arietinum]XP_004513752.1 uncharacterized protein At3g28850-like [Cicer arietinum]
MGCGSSKRIDATAPLVYQPPPTSFAVFDINAIEEPWLKHLNNNNNNNNNNISQDKPSLPPPILQILDATEKSPQSWDEVSKTLQHLKPTVQPPPTQSPPPLQSPQQQPQPQPPRKVASFHTLEELDSKLTPIKGQSPESTNEVVVNGVKEEENRLMKTMKPSLSSKLKDNIFIVKDRLEKQKEERESNLERLRRDPLSNYPEKCPPGGNDAVVIYTTSLGGVRKTFDDCNRARDLLENQRVIFDERDVALHGEFLKEVKELLLTEEEIELGNGVVLPRVFVKGRYLGGLKELVELNETGRLGRILNATRVERGVGRQGCGGCGGVRFVPCLDCGGSCKMVLNNTHQVQRCLKCNENGLVHCPACL